MSPIYFKKSGAIKIIEKKMLQRKDPHYSAGMAARVLNMLRAEKNDVNYNSGIVNSFLRQHKDELGGYIEKIKVEEEPKPMKFFPYIVIERMCKSYYRRGKIRKYTKKELKEILGDIRKLHLILPPPS